MKSVGFIGLGTMGKPMAANLLEKGYSLIVFNRSLAKTEELVRKGAGAAHSPAEAARSVSVLFTMVSNDAALQEVFYQDGGIMDGVHSGLTVIDCSTVSPDTSRRLSGDLQAHGARFLDAPVTGSKPQANEGALAFMVGGPKDVFDEHIELFNAMGKVAVYMGPTGAGAQTKLAHNTIAALNLAALSEGLAMAVQAGLDPEAFLRIVGSGGANSRMAEMKGGKIIERDFSVQFALQLMLKDLNLASAAAQQANLPAPLLQAARSLYQMAYLKGFGAEDMASIVRCYEDWINLEITKAPFTRKPSRESSTAGADYAGKDSSAAYSDSLPGKNSSAYSDNGMGQAEQQHCERRRSIRIPMGINLHLSVYQWEQEGSFSGQTIEGKLYDLSDGGLMIGSGFPLAKDMFVVLHFPEEAALPPITAKIIRIDSGHSEFRYGCMLSGVSPFTRVRLEEYIEQRKKKLEKR
jgi:3-hydroxyisobutyrate dehydrogenase-like beta-hydroxyacid dehydrogenase